MAINFDRAMIELVREIRRRVPSDIKPGIKLANPDILNELTDVYFSTQDVILKTLIKELFERAGEPWPTRLLKEEATPQYQAKVYRGNTQLTETPRSEAKPSDTKENNSANPEEATSQKPNKRTRIYRGRVIPA